MLSAIYRITIALLAMLAAQPAWAADYYWAVRIFGGDAYSGQGNPE